MKKEDDRAKQTHVKGQAEGVFAWWNNLSTIRPEDSPATKVKRVLIRIVGIIFLIVFSPFLLLALLVAFLAML
ncbi:MAG: hypothetical protein AAFX87_05970 [Bacteroidota bacterium]